MCTLPLEWCTHKPCPRAKAIQKDLFQNVSIIRPNEIMVRCGVHFGRGGLNGWCKEDTLVAGVHNGIGWEDIMVTGGYNGSAGKEIWQMGVGWALWS